VLWQRIEQPGLRERLKQGVLGEQKVARTKPWGHNHRESLDCIQRSMGLLWVQEQQVNMQQLQHLVEEVVPHQVLEDLSIESRP
jgi:hypothetical protein